jgi:hypothetical protein
MRAEAEALTAQDVDLVADQPVIDNSIDLELDAPALPPELIPWEQLALPGEKRLDFIRRIIDQNVRARGEERTGSKRWSQIDARAEQRLLKEYGIDG